MAFKPKYSKRLGRRQGSRPHSYAARKLLQDDPAMAASRAVDWEDFLGAHNPRYKAFVNDFAQGKSAKHTAARFGFSSSWAHELKEKLAADLREYFGDEAIADSMQIPSWRGNIMVDHEKAACRADRRRC